MSIILFKLNKKNTFYLIPLSISVVKSNISLKLKYSMNKINLFHIDGEKSKVLIPTYVKSSIGLH